MSQLSCNRERLDPGGAGDSASPRPPVAATAARCGRPAAYVAPRSPRRRPNEEDDRPPPCAGRSVASSACWSRAWRGLRSSSPATCSTTVVTRLALFVATTQGRFFARSAVLTGRATPDRPMMSARAATACGSVLLVVCPPEPHRRRPRLDPRRIQGRACRRVEIERAPRVEAWRAERDVGG